jgi:hypothetical protein
MKQKSLLQYLFEPPRKLTLTWMDGHVTYYTGWRATAMVLFLFPSLFIDLVRHRARLADKDRTVEVIWPS